MPQNNVITRKAERSPWLAVSSIVLGTFMVVVSEILPVGLLTDVSQHFHISEGLVGGMVTAMGVSATFSALFLGIMIGKTNRRTVFCLLSLLMLLSNVVIVIAPNFTWVIVARLVSGICVGGYWTFAFAAVRRLVSPELADRATAIVLAAVSAAMVLGVPVGSFLATTVGWRSAFMALAVLAMMALVIQLKYLPSLPAQATIKPSDMRSVLKIPQARWVLLFIGMVITGHFSAQTYLKPLLEQNQWFSANNISVLLLIYGLAGFVGTYIAERATKNHLRLTIMSASILMSLALVLTLFSVASLTVTSVMVWGLAYGIIPVGIQIWMYRAVPSLLIESSSALIVVMFQIAIALGAFLGGLVVDGIGVNSAMVLGALLGGIATLITLKVKQ